MVLRTLLAVVVLASCGGGDDAPRPLTFGGDRPTDLEVPVTLTEGKRYPLYLVLHGFGANGFAQAAYFGVSGLPAANEALVIAPDGTPNSAGRQFWNADPACCDFEGQQPDDVAYLGGLIDDVLDTWPVDPDQVFVVGHSNGGFMAYRLACERADVIAAIGSLAGLASSTAAACQPAREVNVLQIHGTIDATVPYTGGGTGIGAVGAEGSVMQWGTHNGCGTTRTDGDLLDLENSVPGAETHPHTTNGCPENGAVDLWEMQGAGHIPIFSPTFTPTLVQWFADHRRS
jgi:polyhydroxybutyrate depolymerase